MMNIQMHVGFLLSFWMLLPHLLTHILQQDAVSEGSLNTVAHLTPMWPAGVLVMRLEEETTGADLSWVPWECDCEGGLGNSTFGSAAKVRPCVSLGAA